MNNVELYLLKALLIRDNYEKYRQYLGELFNKSNPLGKVFLFLEKQIKGTETELLLDEFKAEFFTENAFLREEDLTYFSEVFEKLAVVQLSEESMSRLLRKFQEKSIATDLARVALDMATGKEGSKEKFKVLSELLYSEDDVLEEPTEELVSTSLTELLEKQITTKGLEWRLNCLNESLGPLRKGDFGFLFARPETGKTTFLASEISYFLDQVETPILWFNNEEQGDKVMLRVYQAIFGITLDQLKADPRRYEEEYNRRFSGRFAMVDQAHLHRDSVHRTIERMCPSLIIFDQIDKLKGFDDDRNDLSLGSIYIWAREIAKEFAPVIGVCQAGASGENKMWLDMNDVVNAKTSKQAEADWILGIGAKHESETLRYFNISKNKLVGGPRSIPESRHGRFTTIIKPEIGRYEDL